MTPETNKVSKCCGDRLVAYSGPKSAYTCFNCKKPCDAIDNCADCFPQHYPETEYKNQTVPICEKHATERYTEDRKKSANVMHSSIKEIPRTDDSYATLIGGIILNCGNLYNENKQDITVRVAEYVYKNYIK